MHDKIKLHLKAGNGYYFDMSHMIKAISFL